MSSRRKIFGRGKEDRVPINGLAVLARGGLVTSLGDVVLLHIVEAAKVVVLDLAQLEEVAAKGSQG